MNLHEYQGKQLFAEYGLPVSKGYAVDTPQEAYEACGRIGGDEWVVKAQVHAGGRGKAGGVKLVKSKEEAKEFAAKWLGQRLVTYQTDANGQPVTKILVESCTDIDQELYLGAVVDRSSRRIVFMASTEGGVDIEKVAHDTPEKILKATIDPLVGAQPYQGRDLAFQLGLKGDQIKQFTQIFVGLAKLFQDYDLALLEVNPLVIKKDGNLHCLDAKINIDTGTDKPVKAPEKSRLISKAKPVSVSLFEDNLKDIDDIIREEMVSGSARVNRSDVMRAAVDALKKLEKSEISTLIQEAKQRQ